MSWRAFVASLTSLMNLLCKGVMMNSATLNRRYYKYMHIISTCSACIIQYMICKKGTQWQCKGCSVWLCFTGTSEDCFHKWHKQHSNEELTLQRSVYVYMTMCLSDMKGYG